MVSLTKSVRNVNVRNVPLNESRTTVERPLPNIGYENVLKIRVFPSSKQKTQLGILNGPHVRGGGVYNPP